MSFAPPPDYTKVLVAATIGVCCALTALIITADHSPHVGDNIHHLPHGGAYQDGNKRILYGPPRPSRLPGQWGPALLVLALSCCIVASERCRRASHACRCTHI